MTAVVVLAILWLTLAPKPLPDSDVHWFEGADKVVHGCMFGGLFFVMGLDWVISGRKLGLPVGMALAGVCVAFGGGIELVQGAMDMGRGRHGGGGSEFGSDACDCQVAHSLKPGTM